MPTEGDKKEISMPVQGSNDALDSLSRKASALNQQVNDLAINSQEKCREFERESTSLWNRLAAELEEFNEYVANFVTETGAVKAEILTASHTLINSIAKSRQKLNNGLFYTIYISVVGLIISEIFSAPFAVLTVFMIASSAAAAANICLRLLEKDLQNHKSSTEQAIKKISNVITLAPHKLRIAVDFQPINKKASDLLKDLDSLRNVVSSYLRQIEAYYVSKNKRNKLKLFSQTYRSSITTLNISLKKESNNFLNSFYSKEDDEEKWAQIVSKRITNDCGVPEEILNVAFYEYVQSSRRESEWELIAEKPELLTCLAKLMCEKNLETVYFDKRLIENSSAVVSMLEISGAVSLNEFESCLRKFYLKLNVFKKTLISALRAHNIIDENCETKVLKYVPYSSDEENYQLELFNYVSKILKLQTEYVQLIYYNTVGDKERGQKIWRQLVHDEDLRKGNERRKKLVSFLMMQRLLSYPPEYHVDQVTSFSSDVIESLDDCNLLSIEKAVNWSIQELDGFKDLILKAVENFTQPIDISTVREIDSFLPAKKGLSNQLLGEIATKIKIEMPLIRLFFLTYTKKGDSQNSAFLEVKEEKDSNSLLYELAELLVQSKRIEIFGEEIEAVQNLVTILKHQEKLDLVETQLLVNKYSSLMRYNRQLSEFLYREKLLVDARILSFEVLFDLMKKSAREETYTQLDLLVKFIINTASAMGHDHTMDQLDELVLASLALFTWEKKDNTVEEACGRAARSDLACHIVYQYCSLNDAKMGEETIYLRDVFWSVISGKYVDEELFAEFRLHLLRGIIISRKQSLINFAVNGVKQKLDEMEDVRKTLIECQDDFKTVLRTELGRGAVNILLNSNSVCAYLITTNGRSPVIRSVIDGMVNNKQNVGTDDQVGNLLLFDPKSKVAGGFYTRLGLVPLGMPFLQFSTKFEKVFNSAKDAYIQSHPRDAKKDYTINLVRIIPSEIGLKTIHDYRSLKKHQQLFENISDLMIKKFELIDNFELVISVSGEDARIKVKKLWITAIDSSASLFTIISSEITPILQKNRKLKQFLKNETLDKELKVLYGCQRLSELAIRMKEAKQNHATIPGNSFEDIFLEQISAILQKHDVRVDNSEIAQLSSTVMSKLVKHGKVLSLD